MWEVKTFKTLAAQVNWITAKCGKYEIMTIIVNNRNLCKIRMAR